MQYANMRRMSESTRWTLIGLVPIKDNVRWLLTGTCDRTDAAVAEGMGAGGDIMRSDRTSLASVPLVC